MVRTLDIPWDVYIPDSLKFTVQGLHKKQSTVFGFHMICIYIHKTYTIYITERNKARLYVRHEKKKNNYAISM